MVLNEREERKRGNERKNQRKNDGKIEFENESCEKRKEGHVSDFPEIGRVSVTAEK